MARGRDGKLYLEYLEKEMTIMGVLSALSLAAAGGTLSLVLGQKEGYGEKIWTHGHWAITFGSFLCVGATALFYKQRSLLAWFYGEICLDPLINENRQVVELLTNADSWETWIWYSFGFDALTLGFLDYAAALISISWLPKHMAWLWLFRVAPFFIFAPVVCLQWYVLTRYKENERPWSDWFHQEIRKPAPHHRVYSRIQSSPCTGLVCLPFVRSQLAYTRSLRMMILSCPLKKAYLWKDRPRAIFTLR